MLILYTEQHSLSLAEMSGNKTFITLLFKRHIVPYSKSAVKPPWAHAQTHIYKYHPPAMVRVYHAAHFIYANKKLVFYTTKLASKTTATALRVEVPSLWLNKHHTHKTEINKPVYLVLSRYILYTITHIRCRVCALFKKKNIYVR